MTVERISVVLPVYNERENIAPCLLGLAKALERVEHEILVCYDFDEDTTLEGIRAMGAAAPRTIRLVKNTLGRGPHKAIQAGFQAASGDVVVTTMADLSDPPELIPALADHVRAGAAVVSGSRYAHGGSQKGGPLLKRTLSRVAGVSLAWIGGCGTHDATSNFRAYSKRFLGEVVIEATAGFEIALELTVKAHLAGERVDEVASSWVDRTAGESRFRLWKWLPNYLRWYLRAMREPLAVWVAFVLALAAMLGLSSGPENELARVMLVAEGLLCGASLLWARSLRGRTVWSDVLLPIVWLVPFGVPGSYVANLALLARAIATLLLLWTTCGQERVLGALRSVAGRCNQRGIGVLLLVLFVWSAHLSPTVRSAAGELDPSWQQSLGRALRAEIAFGREILFTYGPLGYFLESPFEPGLFWTKQLAFEAAFKCLAACIVVAVALRIGGVLQRSLFLLAFAVPAIGYDAWALLIIASTTAWLFAGPERRVLAECAALLVLAVLALVKFTWFVFAAIAVAGVVLWLWRARGPHRAVRTATLFLAFVAGLWTAAGQNPFDLPAYVWTSLEITGGYSAAMSFPGSAFTFELARWCFLLLALVAFLTLIPKDGRWKRAVFAAVVLAGAFLAFKAGFVRSFGNAITLFCYAGAAAMLFGVRGDDVRQPATAAARVPGSGARAERGAHDQHDPQSSPGAHFQRGWRVRRGLSTTLSVSTLLLALYGYGVARDHPAQTFERLFIEWSHETWERARRILDPGLVLAEIREENANYVAQTDLPGIRARVGRDTVDLIANTQGMLHANGLAWKPRPAFQSYVAYTPRLLEANARFLAGPDAPRYVLFQFETMDDHMPQLDDTLAMQVLSRAWRPVMEEGPFLLLERWPADPGAPGAPDAPGAAPPRALQVERELAYGEWLEIGELEGRCHVLHADFEPTLIGRLMTFAYRAPSIFIELEDTQDRKATYRLVPAMATAGVFVNPFLIGNGEWMRWFTGEECARVRRFRFLLRDERAIGTLLDPRVRVRIERAEELVPRALSAVERIRRWPMMVTPPKKVDAKFPWYTARVGEEEVLVVHAPSDIVFELSPGRWRLTGRYGILDGAWQEALTDGVKFAIVVLDAQGKERKPFERLLAPTTVEADRGPHELSLELSIAHKTPLFLRTRPGPLANTNSDWAWWTKLALERLGDPGPPR